MNTVILTHIPLIVYSKVSVIRGTVLLRDGSPALGTRVEVSEQREAGFTLTRQNGT